MGNQGKKKKAQWQRVEDAINDVQQKHDEVQEGSGEAGDDASAYVAGVVPGAIGGALVAARTGKNIATGFSLGGALGVIAVIGLMAFRAWLNSPGPQPPAPSPAGDPNPSSLRSDPITLSPLHERIARPGGMYPVSILVSTTGSPVNIYTVKVTLRDGGTALDAVEQDFNGYQVLEGSPLRASLEIRIPDDARGDYMLRADVTFETGGYSDTIRRQGPGWDVHIR